jgi:hypothetical protein
MSDQAEGRQAKLVFVEETVFGTKETTPAGWALPYTNMDLNPGEGFTDFEEIDALSVPSKPMGAKHQPAGNNIELPLHYDAWGFPLKYAIADAVTTGTDPYLHTYTLGAALSPGLELERQQGDLTKGNRLFYGGRVATMDFSMDLEGAVKMGLSFGFLRYEAWSATPQVAAPTAYTSDPIDSLLGIIKIDGSAVGYIAAFNFTLDWQLDQDKYPVGNEGWRTSLSRGKPMLGGSLDAFLDDDTVTDLVDAAEAGTAVTFETLFETTNVTESLSFQIANAVLKVTGEPVPDSKGVNVQFDWKASGAGCLICELYNDVISY